MGKLLAGSRFFCMVGLPIFRNNCRNPRRKQHFRAPIANRHIPSLDDNPFRSIVGSGRINIRSIYALFRSGSRTEYLARYLCCFRNHHGTCHSQHLLSKIESDETAYRGSHDWSSCHAHRHSHYWYCRSYASSNPRSRDIEGQQKGKQFLQRYHHCFAMRLYEWLF